MPIFISYARKDRQAVEALSRDLERAHNSVWMDNELTGGQEWWDAILRLIRSCDLYVFALSPESLKSRACRLEFEYALAVGRPLLPVLIRDVAINLAPPAIANTHVVDYRQRTVDSGIALISAVAGRPPAPQLPDPLPEPPAPPISYMNEYRDLLDAPFLTYQQQRHLLVDLGGYLTEDEDDRETALDLIRALRRRRDIAESVGRDIDQLLAAQSRQQGSFEPPRSAPTPPPQTFEQTQAARMPTQPSPDFRTQQPSPSRQPPTYQQPTYQQPTYQQPTNQAPPQQPPPRQPPYQPQYGTQAGPAQGQPLAAVHPQATIVLALGILGFLTCGITGIVAVVMGGRALREIDAQPGQYTGRSQVNLGRILGWVTVGLGGLYLLLVLIGLIQSY